MLGKLLYVNIYKEIYRGENIINDSRINEYTPLGIHFNSLLTDFSHGFGQKFISFLPLTSRNTFDLSLILYFRLYFAINLFYILQINIFQVSKLLKMYVIYIGRLSKPDFI